MKNIGIVGLGLIGGSYGLALRQTGKYRIFGYDADPEHQSLALELGLADDILSEPVWSSLDGVILAVPVDVLPSLARQVLDKTNDNCWVADTGSIKSVLARKLADHPGRDRFVLSHPIAGTEYSGPSAALPDLFKGKINIITDPEDSRPDLLEEVVQIHRDLAMEVHFMPSDEHDRHIAYVSHLSHISAFMLGKTVLETEPSEKNIFLMAGSGFASTVRLAKSSPETWTPIFTENKDAILPVLKKYRENLDVFIRLLENEDKKTIFELLKDINRIEGIIDDIHQKHGKR